MTDAPKRISDEHFAQLSEARAEVAVTAESVVDATEAAERAVVARQDAMQAQNKANVKLRELTTTIRRSMGLNLLYVINDDGSISMRK